MAELLPDCFYWIKGPDGEPEPARFDGTGWATLVGGAEGEIEIELLSTAPIFWDDHIKTMSKSVYVTEPPESQHLSKHLKF